MNIEHVSASFALLTFVGAFVHIIKAHFVYALVASTLFIWANYISDEFHYTLVLVKKPEQECRSQMS